MLSGIAFDLRAVKRRIPYRHYHWGLNLSQNSATIFKVSKKNRRQMMSNFRYQKISWGQVFGKVDLKTIWDRSLFEKYFWNLCGFLTITHFPSGSRSSGSKVILISSSANSTIGSGLGGAKVSFGSSLIGAGFVSASALASSFLIGWIFKSSFGFSS